MSGAVDQLEVEAGQVQRPVSLATVKFLSCHEVLQVLVVCLNLHWVSGSLQEMPPFYQCTDNVRATGTPDSRRILSNITVYNYDTTHLQENPQRLG